MTYTELLMQEEWIEKGCTILSRDKLCCKDCGKIGFHNGTFIRLDSINEINELLRKLGVINIDFQGFIDYLSDKEYIGDCKNVELSIKGKYKGRFVYEPNFVGKLYHKSQDIFGQYPFNLRIVTERQYDNANFKIKYFVKDNVYEVPGEYNNVRGYLLGTDNVLTNKIFVCLENITFGGISSYDNPAITMASILSITFGKYVLCIFLKALEGLNIHHTYYLKDKFPWEYEDDSLVALCESCHQKRHEVPVPCYRSIRFKEITGHYNKCGRCNGTGYLPQYDHIENGVCFKCGGEGCIID